MSKRKKNHLWAIDSLMNDLRALQEENRGYDPEEGFSDSSARRHDIRKRMPGSRISRDQFDIPTSKSRSKRIEEESELDKFSLGRLLSEKIEYYQRKLNALSKTEELDALLSKTASPADYDPHEMKNVMESVKSILAEYDRKVHQEQIPEKEDSVKIQKELDQMRAVLGALMENVSRIMEVVGINNDYLVRQKKDSVPMKKNIFAGTIEKKNIDKQDKDEPILVPPPEICDSNNSGDTDFSGIEKKEFVLPLDSDLGQEDLLSEQTEPVSDQEIQTAEEEILEKEGSEKLKELKEHLNQVSKMIEKRSSRMEDANHEQESIPVEEQDEEVQDSDCTDHTVSPSPLQLQETPGSEDNRKNTGESIQDLKSSMSPVDLLTFEQYLQDLHAYDCQNRAFAVHRLGMMRCMELTGIILDAWEKEEDNTVRSEMLNALANMDFKDAIPFFKNALQRQDPRIVVAALEGLYRFQGKEAGREFVKALDHSHYSVRRRAATYLGWIEAEWAIPDLVKLLHDPDVYNRKVVVNIFSSFRVKEVISFLVEALNDPEQRVRESIINVLAGWTGQNMGYDPQDKEDERQEAINAWKQWWKQSEAGFEFHPKGGD